MNKYTINLDIMKQLGAKIYGNWDGLLFAGLGFESQISYDNMLFIGIKGSNTDGTDFAIEAVKNGSSGLIVSKKLDCDVPQIVVDNVVALIYRYAAIVREQYKNNIIAVCGAAGKTTLKNNIVEILPGNVLYTKRSFNIKLSIALTMLFLNNNIDYFVVECGHSVPGEMVDFGQFLKPDYVIYSTIGEEHIETFKTIDVIQYEQSTILPHTSKAYIADEDYVKYLETTRFPVIPGYSNEPCVVNNNQIMYKNHNYDIHPLTTKANINTLKKVIVLMDLLKISIKSDKLLNLNTICMRGNSIKTQNGIIFDYSFNCNKTSLLNTLEFLNNYCEKYNKTVDFIFGYMGIITEENEEENYKALELLINNSNIRNIYTVNIKYNNPKCKELNQFDDFSKLSDDIFIQGSKHNNLIEIICSLISFRSAQPKSSYSIKNL